MTTTSLWQAGSWASVRLLQLSSTPLEQFSVALGRMAALLSLQSPPQVVYPSPSTSKPSSIPLTQLSSIQLHTSATPGCTAAFPSLQSPPQVVYPSASASKPSSIPLTQLSSIPLHTSATPGCTAALASLQSPPQEAQPSASASGKPSSRTPSQF